MNTSFNFFSTNTNTPIPRNILIDGKLCNYGALGVYADGKLEDYLGHDVVLIPYDTNTANWDIVTPNGIHNVQIEYNGKYIDAVLYKWYSSEYNRSRGLCVFADDTESVEYAKRMYENKSNL